MRVRSYVTNLLEFLENATAAIDREEAFDIVYLDFAKAFDKVPDQRPTELQDACWTGSEAGSVTDARELSSTANSRHGQMSCQESRRAVSWVPYCLWSSLTTLTRQ